MYSLLTKNRNQQFYTEKMNSLSMPNYLIDLNVDQVIDAITEDWDEKLGKLYYWLPEDNETEDYRRDIYSDIKNDKVYAKLKNYLEVSKKRGECMVQKDRVELKVQRFVWHVREVVAYVEAVEYLLDILDEPGIISEGMKGLREYLKKYTASSEYTSFRNEAAGLIKLLKEFRFLISYENGRIVVTEGKGNGSYEDFLEQSFPNHGKILLSPFTASPVLTDLEREISEVIVKNHRGYFERAAEFCMNNKEYAREDILNLPAEISYYIAHIEFTHKLQDKGMNFCRPKVAGNKLSATGMYDLALACVNIREEKEIVANDFEVWSDEKFIVLTGPNQGGKTTFARSLGQMIYFTKMGLDVPAVAAYVPYFSQIMSHFSVEESVETGKGKLMEELSRLKPMMDDGKNGAFVVINELFTTAANYDANIMGRRVLEYFIDHNCRGIYVTHLNELSTAHPNVVSFRATTDENNKQTFKVIRSEAQETVGAGIQVKKYGLTYEQIRGRFS